MKPKLNINEDFICRIWEGGKKYFSGLVSDRGDDVEIIRQGERNYDSGPDYKNAVVKIGGKTFTGDIEIHRDFKNWDEHSHPKDRRYNSVILHVVLWDDIDRKPPKLRIRRHLPTVILSNHLRASIHDIWQDIISEPSPRFRIPCYDYNDTISDDTILNMLSKAADERLHLKISRIKRRLAELSPSPGGDIIPAAKQVWEQALYEFIFEALGFSKNKVQMLKLSSNVPLKLLYRYAGHDTVKIQAILFGAAGLFFDIRSKDAYIDTVKDFWRNIEGKLKIQLMNRNEWNFFGQRPQNYPTLRIAYGSQIAAKLMFGSLMKAVISLFSADLNSKKLFAELISLFEPIRDDYWQSHYDLGKASKTVYALGGRQRLTDIIINVLVPFVYLYGDTFNKSVVKLNSIELYNNLSIKSDNNITRLMHQQLIKHRALKMNTPAKEQAVIQLHNFYCTRGKCENCLIGKEAFKNKGYDYKIIYY